MPILELENVGYSYDKSTKVLEKINYSFEKGESMPALDAPGQGKLPCCRDWPLRQRVKSHLMERISVKLTNIVIAAAMSAWSFRALTFCPIWLR